MPASEKSNPYREILTRFSAETPDLAAPDSTDPVVLCEFVATKAPSGTARIWLTEILAAAGPKAARPALGLWALLAAGLVGAAAVVYGLFLEPTFLKSLSDIGTARGLITFLFAIATVVVVLVTVFATFWMDVEEVERRSATAKEVLTVMIGIMGTVLGFYFGSTDTQTATPPASSVQASTTN